MRDFARIYCGLRAEKLGVLGPNRGIVSEKLRVLFSAVKKGRNRHNARHKQSTRREVAGVLGVADTIGDLIATTSKGRL
jgi:hypothetical protein